MALRMARPFSGFFAKRSIAITFDCGAGDTAIMPCSAAICSPSLSVVSSPKMGVLACFMRRIACRMSSWLFRISISELIISVLAATGSVISR